MKNVLERIAEGVAAVMPEGVTEDVRNNVQAAVRSACEGLELVTREELEVQEAVLRRTREKVERLEQLVTDLERRVAQTQSSGSPSSES